MAAPLDGIRVLELGHYIAAPFCGQILADHGAEVIKIEPLAGEPSRNAHPKQGDSSLYFASFNRGKQSIALDLKSPDGQALLYRLIEESDVLITNYGPGVPAKLGFDYAKIAALNPKMIMLHLTGFGLHGPLQDRHAFDGAVQAMSGIMHLTGDADGPPLKAGVYVADHLTGIQGALGVLLALQGRSSTGKGQLVDVAMLDSCMALMGYEFARAAAGSSDTPIRNGNRSANVFATTFRTSDGYVYIAPIADEMWRRLSILMGRPELAGEGAPYRYQEGRLANYAQLEAIVNTWTAKYSSDELAALLQEQRIPHGVVNDLDTLLDHPHVAAREMLLQIPYDGIQVLAPGIVVRLSGSGVEGSALRAHALGEDTTTILQELGYGGDEVESLVSSGTVRTAASAPRVAVSLASRSPMDDTEGSPS